MYQNAHNRLTLWWKVLSHSSRGAKAPVLILAWLWLGIPGGCCYDAVIITRTCVGGRSTILQAGNQKVSQDLGSFLWQLAVMRTNPRYYSSCLNLFQGQNPQWPNNLPSGLFWKTHPHIEQQSYSTYIHGRKITRYHGSHYYNAVRLDTNISNNF